MPNYNVENIKSIDESEVTTYNQNARLTNAEEPFIIDSETRTINVPSGFLLGVESDEKVERIYFQCPKIVGDNVDLSQLRIYVNYQNANGDKDAHWCDDLQTDGDNITFSWLLDRKVTIYRGNVSFIVCAKKSNDDGTLTNEWNTTVAIARVLEGLEATEQIVEDNQDVIEQILNKLQDIEDSGGTGDISNAKPTFTEAGQRQNIESGETLSTILGKIKKFFTDLKSVAFTGSYNDLSDKPNIPTNTSELTNDSGFLTAIPQEYVTETELEEKDYAVKSEIPTKLPNPNVLTFTGAASGTYDGSSPLSIEIPQGGGSGEKEWITYQENKPLENDVKFIGFNDLRASEILLIFNGRENNEDDTLENGIGQDGAYVNGKRVLTGTNFTYIRKEGFNFDTTLTSKVYNKKIIDGSICVRGNSTVKQFIEIIKESEINSVKIVTNNYFKKGSTVTLYYKEVD